MVDHYIPEYDKDSGSLRMYEYLQLFMQLGYKVVFWPDNLFSSPYTEVLQQLGVEVIYGNMNFEEYIERNGRYLDIAYLCRPHIAVKYIQIIKRLAKAFIIYDTHDLCFLREMRRAELEQGNGVEKQKLLEAAHTTKKTELYLASQSDKVLVVSPVEKDILEKEDNSLNVSVIPHAYRIASSIPGFEARDNLLFIAGFAHPPNADGILWFAHEVFPKIKQKLPGIKLFLVGSNPTQEVLRLVSDEIVVTGYVADVEPFFKACRVFVSPLRYGAGIKGKNLLSMSYGIPVVTTSIGAEGMELIDGENVLIADSEGEFADKVVRLYSEKELWARVSTSSIEYLRKNHTPERCSAEFLKIFSDLNGKD